MIVLGYTEAAFQNTYDGELLFECPAHDQTIHLFKSAHDNGHEDRIFELDCKPVEIEAGGTPACSWESMPIVLRSFF